MSGSTPRRIRLVAHPVLSARPSVRLSALVPALLGFLLLAGCAGPGQDRTLRPGVSRVEQVIAAHGRPHRSWPEADGGQTLEYSSQPYGHSCIMVRFDAEGRLLAIEDALAADKRSRVEPGMSAEQVSRLLGQERSRVFFRLSGEEVWDWNVRPEQSGHLLRFNVHFRQGRVLRSTHSMEFPTWPPGMAD